MKDLYLESLFETLEFINLARHALQLAIVTDPEALEKADDLEIETYERIAARLRVLKGEKGKKDDTKNQEPGSRDV